ncbi:MAG: protein-(glutamine-N5) methyltransferase, release factor-specific [Desulfobacteraceae bacterium 4572_123]|nr:MAG: protein-(glutamine-N5) methyltransferase, release factor-specific [Desulfobacteraceae bacterium 4572_123]
MQNPLQTSEKHWTILDLLKWTTGYFKSHAVEDSRASAEVLLAHVLDLKRIDLYVRYDQPLGKIELTAFKALIKRRIAREPVAYILGGREFWSMNLKVSENVLIPRPETECLVEAALDVLPENVPEEPKQVLELGTGSGAIVLALASERPVNSYFASDVSPAAVALARGNARRHRLDDRIFFFAGAWFDAMDGNDLKFDLIVSNPPYIPTGDIKSLQPEIRKYEPCTALDGGSDGLDCLHLIIRRAVKYLAARGILLLEMGSDQRNAIDAAAGAAGCYDRVEFMKDYGGHDRIAKLRKKGD